MEKCGDKNGWRVLCPSDVLLGARERHSFPKKPEVRFLFGVLG
jgi:hypothetical protein